jgi:hypothetical protein
MMKNTKNPFIIRIILIFIALIIILIVGYFVFQPAKIHKLPLHVQTVDCDRSKNATAPISPSNKLNDPNSIQLMHAQINGLKPFSTDSAFLKQVDELINKQVLEKVTENRFYEIKSLTNSQPYLIPEAVDMLNEIGYRFQQRLKAKRDTIYRFRVSSLLRTEEMQTKLTHRNRNAVTQSAHLYGTTVDISYKNFYNTATDTIVPSWEAIQMLTKVLIEMRKECRLLVVRERKQACFHITVVVCKNEETRKYSLVD